MQFSKSGVSTTALWKGRARFDWQAPFWPLRQPTRVATVVSSVAYSPIADTAHCPPPTFPKNGCRERKKRHRLRDDASSGYEKNCKQIIARNCICYKLFANYNFFHTFIVSSSFLSCKPRPISSVYNLGSPIATLFLSTLCIAYQPRVCHCLGVFGFLSFMNFSAAAAGSASPLSANRAVNNSLNLCCL